MKTSIRITQYKSTGKYYSHTDVEAAGNYDLHTDEFINIVYSNLPCKGLGADTYVVVTDQESSDGFHERLYHLSELENQYKMATNHGQDVPKIVARD